jgi:aminoglycoside phosphotransferase family enzyme
VSRDILDVLAEAAPQVGTAVSTAEFRELERLTTQALTTLRALIEQRAAQGTPRDCHGDLHLDHIYHFPDQAPPGDLVIIDCIEFNERFRCIDPVADMAFMVMDLKYNERPDLARNFAEAYFEATNDVDGRRLLPLYTAYRATVRGLVDGMLLTEKEVPLPQQESALSRSRAHWSLALAELKESSAQ